MYHIYFTFVLQLQSIKDFEDHDSIDNLQVSNANINYLLQNFTSICKRYTKLMATKHQLQYYMFNNPKETLDTNFVHAVIQLEAATLRLQHIQLSYPVYCYIHDYVCVLSTFRTVEATY